MQSDSAHPEQYLRFCISNQFPSEADATGQWNTLCRTRTQRVSLPEAGSHSSYCPMPNQVSQRPQQLFNSLVQRERKTLTPLPASALHEQNCTHTPTDTRVLDTVLTGPTFPVTPLPFPGRKSIPRPLRLSLFSVLGFYTSHLCLWCLEMRVPDLLAFITWHVADHSITAHVLYTSPATNQKK